MSASLSTVWRAARARLVPFAGESAGYIVLLVCEELVPSPRRVDSSTVHLEADGTVRVLGSEPASEAEAELALRSMLAELLEVASSPGPGLVRSASRPTSGSLRTFAVELEKALIPMNRAAARRALCRLHREAERVRDSGLLAAPSAAGASAPEKEEQVSHERAVERVPPARAPVKPVAGFSPAPPTPRPLGEVTLSPAPRGHREHPQGEHPTRPATVAALRRGHDAHASPEFLDGVGAAPQATANSEEEPTEQFTFSAEPSAVAMKLPAVESMRSEEGAGAWPIELATEAEALPLEADWCGESFRAGKARARRVPTPPARPPSEPPEDVFEVLVESPVHLSALPHVVRLRSDSNAARSEQEPPEERETPVVAVEPYRGMPAQRSDIRELLHGFDVAPVLEEGDLRQELKRWAEVDATPPPKNAKSH
ncbi:MAG TPA: hypothetical protein VIM73_01970 [Polyangiaceae bacterium]